MSIVRFISDLHFGHQWAAQSRGFLTIEEHNDKIIKEWNKIVNKKDMTFILGDITMEDDSYFSLLDNLKGRKILIGGNHDVRSDYSKLIKHVDCIMGCENYRGFILTHIPIHESEMRYYKCNIHGHIHNRVITRKIYNSTLGIDTEDIDPRYKNVCIEKIGYCPKTLKELGLEI